MCECRPYQCVIMLLVLIAFAIICFINDADNDSSEKSYNIITLLDVEINTTILISNTWKPIKLIMISYSSKFGHNYNFSNWKIKTNDAILLPHLILSFNYW